MKKNYFLLGVAIFATLFGGCNNEQPKVKSIVEVKAKASASAAQTATVIFSGDEIVSYNGTTGEIVFANTPKGEVYEVLSEYNNGLLEFYLNGQLLFNLTNRVSDIQSDIHNAPILRYGYAYGGNNGNGNNDNGNTNDSVAHQVAHYISNVTNDNTPKWFIEDGYPDGKTINGVRGTTANEQERQANAQRIMRGFLNFIEALKAEGKYIE